MNKRSNLRGKLTELGDRLRKLNGGFKDDPTYKKMAKQLAKLEKKMEQFRTRYLKNNSGEIDQVNQLIRETKIKIKAGTVKALDPKSYGDPFWKFWNDLFIGTLWFNKKQLMWVSDDQEFCLVKVRDRFTEGTEWMLFKKPNNKPIHISEGRMNWVKKGAFEKSMNNVHKITFE